MSQESVSTIDDDPLNGVDLEGLRRIYKEKLDSAIEAAKKYAGAEAEQENVLAETIAFEETVRNALALPPGKGLPAKVEAKLKHVYAVEGEGTVEEILTLALDSFQKKLEEILELLKLKVIRVDKVVLPPGEGTLPDGGVTEESSKTNRVFVERFKALIVLLNKKGVFIDDIVLIEGKEPTEHVRTEGYRLIEIPRLQRQVLVCDEKGEATFVLLTPIDREYFFTHTKTDLKNSFPGIVKRFYHDSEWLKELEKYLFDGNIVGEKIDLELREAFLADLRKRFPTAKDWDAIGFHARRGLESCGHGLTAISTRLGGPVRPISKVPFLKLGLQIYGHQDEHLNHRIKLEEGDLEEWETAIKKQYPTEAALLNENPRSFKAIEGFQFHAIMEKLGLPHTRGSFRRTDLVLLATHVFGANEHTIATQRKLDEIQKGKEIITDLATAKKAFLEDFPSAQKWIEIDSHERPSLKIKGMSVYSLMQAFAITPLSPGNYLCALRLAEKMYEEGPEADLIKAAIEEELLVKKPEIVRQKLLALHSTPEAWLAVPWPDRYTIKVGEIAPKGLIDLGSTLGVDDTLSGNVGYLRFVAKLFPEDTQLRLRLEEKQGVEAVQKTLGKDPKQWATYLRTAHAATLEEWISDEKATNRERRKKFAGKGLKWIAKNVFGLSCNEPVIERNTYYLLGQRIFS